MVKDMALGIMSRLYRAAETLRPGTATQVKLSPTARTEIARLSFIDEGPVLPSGTPLNNMKVMDGWNEDNWEVYHIAFGPKGKAPNDVVIDLGINATENIKSATIAKLGHDKVSVLLDGNVIATLDQAVTEKIPVNGQVYTSL